MQCLKKPIECKFKFEFKTIKYLKNRVAMSLTSVKIESIQKLAEKRLRQVWGGGVV